MTSSSDTRAGAGRAVEDVRQKQEAREHRASDAPKDDRGKDAPAKSTSSNKT